MNNMEEQLWSYIDGTCSEEERIAIAALIEKDESWKNAFNNIVAVDADISALTLDEPPMAFSYNVMEGIRAHEASKPLKTSVNNYIISSIAGFLILSIIALLLLTFANASQTTHNIATNVHLPDLSAFTDSGVVKVLFYFDTMLLLFLADSFFRRKRTDDVGKSV